MPEETEKPTSKFTEAQLADARTKSPSGRVYEVDIFSEEVGPFLVRPPTKAEFQRHRLMSIDTDPAKRAQALDQLASDCTLLPENRAQVWETFPGVQDDLGLAIRRLAQGRKDSDAKKV